MELSNHNLNSHQLTLQAIIQEIFLKSMQWNLTSSQIICSLHLMCLRCSIEKLLGHHTEGLLTIGLLMHQISTNKNQTKDTNRRT